MLKAKSAWLPRLFRELETEVEYFESDLFRLPMSKLKIEKLSLKHKMIRSTIWQAWEAASQFSDLTASNVENLWQLSAQQYSIVELLYCLSYTVCIMFRTLHEFSIHQKKGDPMEHDELGFYHAKPKSFLRSFSVRDSELELFYLWRECERWELFIGFKHETRDVISGRSILPSLFLNDPLWLFMMHWNLVTTKTFQSEKSVRNNGISI